LEEEIDSRIEELNTKMVYQKVKTTWTITWNSPSVGTMVTKPAATNQVYSRRESTKGNIYQD
jgi:hypothetical protein